MIDLSEICIPEFWDTKNHILIKMWFYRLKRQ